MSHLPLAALHFPMIDLASLRAALRTTPGAYHCHTEVIGTLLWPTLGVDACPTVNTRSTFAELAVELGLREVSQ